MAGRVVEDIRELQYVTRETVLRVLDIEPRNFHLLVARGVLPAPQRHATYDLIACFDHYFLYRCGVPVPSTFQEAARLEAIGNLAMRAFLRRSGEDVLKDQGVRRVSR